MSRPPHQHARVEKINGVWYGCRYRDADGVRKSAPKLPAAKNKTEALAMMTEILVPVNALRREATPGAAMTLGAFVDRIYIPFRRRQWKASTTITTEHRIRQHIIGGALGSVALKDLTREALQAFLDSKQMLSHSMVSHLRWDLRAICRMAAEDGLLPRDHSGSMFTPDTAETADRKILTVAQITTLIAALPLRERLFCRFALFAGMRPGEIAGLRWNSFDGALATIDQRIYKGTADRPKGKRGRNTSRVAALSSALIADLARWREQSMIAGDAYVFPSQALKTPVQYGNMLSGFIQPALKSAGLDWVTFQVMRRTWSSLSKAAGADQQAVADQLGHTVRVDLADYSQSPLAERLAAVEAFERYVQ